MSCRRSKLVKTLGVLLLCVIANVSFSDAHSGRTDGSGGHRDNKNKSGLGSYHYHHGYGPHLHTNGCPYASSTVNNSTSSSSSNSGSSSQASIEKQKELEKEKVKTNGFSKGYSDGYNRNSNNPSYSGNYSELYESKYNEGYEDGEVKFEKEKSEAEEKGYNLGLTGAEISKSSYENEHIDTAYKDAYNKGFKEYQSKKVEEYNDLGLSHGKGDKEMIDMEDLDEIFVTAYKTSYNEGKQILAESYIEKGYNSVLKSRIYKVPNYKNNKYIDWYKEGFEEGIKDIEEATELGYNDGYAKNESNVADNLKCFESVYLENYEKGKADADKDEAKNTMGFTGILSVGWLTRRYREAKRSIR